MLCVLHRKKNHERFKTTVSHSKSIQIDIITHQSIYFTIGKQIMSCSVLFPFVILCHKLPSKIHKNSIALHGSTTYSKQRIPFNRVASHWTVSVFFILMKATSSTVFCIIIDYFDNLFFNHHLQMLNTVFYSSVSIFFFAYFVRKSFFFHFNCVIFCLFEKN